MSHNSIISPILRKTRRYSMLGFLALSMAFAFPTSLHAADGSGSGSVSPGQVDASSSGNDFDFVYTAGEKMGDGSVKLIVPSAFANPTSANTTVVISGGMLADTIDTLDATPLPTGTPGWNEDIQGDCLLCNLSISTDTDAGDVFAGSGSLRIQGGLGIGLGSVARIYYNYASAQDWSGYTRLSFYIRNDALLNVGLLTGARLEISESTGLAASTQYPLLAALLDIDLLESGEWTQVVVDLSSALPETRNAVQSYGLVFPSLANVALSGVVRVDHIVAGPGSPVFDGNSVTANLISLDNGGTVTFNYDDITAPGTSGNYFFQMQQKVDAGGDLTSIANSPLTVQVLSDGSGNGNGGNGGDGDGDDNTHEADVDDDDIDEVAVDGDGDGCFEDQYIDPNGVSDLCYVLEGSGDGCADFFIDLDGGQCAGQTCPDVFWDGTNNVVSAITETTFDLDDDGDLELVCAYDSDGDGENDSYIFLGDPDDPQIGGEGGGQPNPFGFGGSGCALSAAAVSGVWWQGFLGILLGAAFLRVARRNKIDF